MPHEPQSVIWHSLCMALLLPGHLISAGETAPGLENTYEEPEQNIHHAALGVSPHISVQSADLSTDAEQVWSGGKRAAKGPALPPAASH